MNQGTVQSMREGSGGPYVAPTPILRDATFQLIELAFLQVLPAARARRPRLFFTSVGFDGDTRSALHALYRKSDISGYGFGSDASAQQLTAFVTREIVVAAGAGAGARFDLVSIYGAAPAYQVLAMIADGTFRPGLVHCADKDSFDDWASLRAQLTAIGYVCVGELKGAEVLIDSPFFNSPDPRPIVASFDVFDTLIARRCFEPWRIFEQVGVRAGIPDFLAQRRAAEARVLETRYVFDDIYDELASHYGWDQTRRREVQALELACERDAVIPIAENLALVRDGDILVSDMYLGEADIRSLLDRAGLAANVGLYVESHGKSSGRVWPMISAQVSVSRHLGDNPHADVAVPAKLGFETAVTRVSDLNLVERTLLQTGLRDLAMLCREARLRTWHADPQIRTLLAVQTSVNLPLLLLASIAVARRAVALGKTSLSFCSRDGNLWLPLFDAVQRKMGLAIETRYFLTSRIARKKGSETYLSYAREHMGTDAMVVDLCGTGWSMANLAERLELSACDLFLIDHCPPLDIFERSKPTPRTCVVHKLFDKRPNANNIVLELANMAEHPMLTDMRAVGAARVPVFAPHAMTPLEATAIRAQRAAFLACVPLLDQYALKDVLDLDDASIAFLASSLYEYMSKQTDCFQLFAATFLKENRDIVDALIA